jgi:hypothetical protein
MTNYLAFYFNINRYYFFNKPFYLGRYKRIKIEAITTKKYECYLIKTYK